MVLRKEWYKVSFCYCPFSLGPGMVSRDSLTVGALMKKLQSFVLEIYKRPNLREPISEEKWGAL